MVKVGLEVNCFGNREQKEYIRQKEYVRREEVPDKQREEYART